VKGEEVVPQPGGFYGGWITSWIVGPFKGTRGSMSWQKVNLSVLRGQPRPSHQLRIPPGKTAPPGTVSPASARFFEIPSRTEPFAPCAAVFHGCVTSVTARSGCTPMIGSNRPETPNPNATHGRRGCLTLRAAWLVVYRPPGPSPV